MADDSELRQAIFDRPEASAPRLALADWLDGRCDPLGEFIRVQHRLAQPVDNADVFLELENRERELLGEFEQEWVGELATLANWWTFHLGFVDEIALPAETFIHHAACLLAAAPIRVVHFTDVNAERLASCVHLRRLHFIDLSECPLGNAGVRALAQSPHLTGLRGLNLSGVGLANSGAQALARAVSLTDLQELYLSDNRISDVGAQSLARSPRLSQLKELCLRSNPIGPAAAATLRQRFGKGVYFS